MSNPDRGAYTPPTEPPLAFDARQPVRGRGSAPVMLFASAVVLLVLIAAIIAFYRSGVNERAGPPPVIGTPVGAIKGPAPAEAQPSDPAAGLQIYQQAEGQAAPTAPNFTPPPEQPQARVATPPVVAAPPPAPAAGQPTAPVAALPAAAPPALKPSVTATAPAPAPVAAKPVAAAPLAAKPPPPSAKVPAPVAAAPKAPAVQTAAPKPAAPKPVAAKPAAPTPKVEPAKSAGGGVSVQIGALSSRALADKAWNDAAKVAPGAAAGKGKHVEEIQKGGSTLFRTTFTGFASRADAQAFCAKLQAAGKSCFVK